MRFVEYNDIENVTNKILLEFKNSDKYNPEDVWCINEKIDGSNMSLFFDEDDNIRCASRSRILNDNENFYSFQKIFDKYPKRSFVKLKYDVLEYAKKYFSETCSIVSIHGELFGGKYAGLKNQPNSKAIQKRINYTNDTDFIIFDVRAYNEDQTMYNFIPHDILEQLCEERELLCVPIIFTGTLNECLEWSDKHNADLSEIWKLKLVGMPHEVEGNIREGHVIKPLKKTIFKGMHRMIFKDKNTKFKEKMKNKNREKKDKVPVDISKEVVTLLDHAREMICINRFFSVTSKFGEYNIRNFKDLMILMTDDVIDEFVRDLEYKFLYESLKEIDKKILRDNLIRLVSKFMGYNKKELF